MSHPTMIPISPPWVYPRSDGVACRIVALHQSAVDTVEVSPLDSNRRCRKEWEKSLEVCTRKSQIGARRPPPQPSQTTAIARQRKHTRRVSLPVDREKKPSVRAQFLQRAPSPIHERARRLELHPHFNEAIARGPETRSAAAAG